MIKQEIEKIRREIRELQQLQKSAIAKKAQRPNTRIGKIKAVSTDENNNSIYEVVEIRRRRNRAKRYICRCSPS